MKGEEEGWKFLKALDANIAQYIKSGSKPCKAAAAGEFAIGASFAFSAVKLIMEGYPITLVVPSEGAGYEMEVSGLMKTAKNKEDAKKFLDWLSHPRRRSSMANAPQCPRCLERRPRRPS